jgi:hypothetical protein
MIDARIAQQRLAVVWFVGGGLAFVWLMLQTWGGLYADTQAAKNAWSWFSAAILPTLSLMIGVLAHQATTSKKQNPRKAPILVFRIGFCLSVLYMLAVFAVVVLARGYANPTGFLMDSSLYLGLLQGLVGAALGVFFASPKA